MGPMGGRSRRGLVVVVALVSGLLLMFCGSAWGTTGHGLADSFGGVGIGDGQFNPTVAGVGVGASGDVFVSDQHVSAEGASFPRVQRFDGLGGFVAAIDVDGSEFQSLGAVAVDSAGAGGVYVSAVNALTGVPVVAKYSAAGAFAHVLDTAGSTTSINYSGPVAVDPSNGTVYATAVDTADPNSPPVQVIDSFDPTTGAFIASFDGANGSLDGGFACTPTGLAVDGAHRVYVLDPCKGTGRVDEYSSAGVYGATVDGDSPMGVATDPVSGEVYVTESSPAGLRVTHFTAGGVSPVQTFGASSVVSLSGMAVGPDGTVYLGDSTNAVVARFTAFEGPTVATGSATSITTTSATLNGTVDPGGVAAHCRYEYGLDANYGSSTEDFDVGSGNATVAAAAPVLGLVPNTTYHYRIVCFNSSGSIVGEDRSFTTAPAPPVIDGSPAFASAITPTTVRVHGTVNPNHTQTHFHIDYGTTATYGSVAPAPDGDATSASVDTPVVANLIGLEPATLYHFRVTADNGIGGPQHGADGTFITAPAAAAGATDITTAKATLTATINPHGAASTYHFEYGPTASYGSTTPEVDAGSGSAEQGITQTISGLSPSQTYHVRVVASSGGIVRSGADGTFTTAPGPTATAGIPVGITLNAATLVGEADAHGLTGSYRFELASLDSSYAISTAEQPVPIGDGVHHLTAAVTGLPAGEGFRVRLIVSSNDAVDYSDQITFATPSPSGVFPLSPPSGQVYGCPEPRLDAYNQRPKPGETIRVTGSGLGTGGSAVLGDRILAPTDWSATGFSLQIPGEAKGTLALTINCGQVSNTIAIAIYSQPDNRFTITKQSAGAVAAELSVKLPGPGKIRTSGVHTTAATMTIMNAGTSVIRVRLTRAGSKALNKSRARRLKATIRVRYTPAGGEANIKTITLTFKAKASR
jgi:hypothetical protein